MRVTLAALLFVIALFGQGLGIGFPIDPDIKKFVQNEMTLEEKVGQMIQLDISLLMENDYNWNLNLTALADFIVKYKVGSFLNSPSSTNANLSCPTVEVWRQIITDIQEVAVKYGSKNIPILYGLDTVHGANYIYGAALFPQQLGIAATFNTTHAFECGVTGGKDTRAVGIPWVFSPILGVASHQAWPRNYETFGEDPLVVTKMGEAIIKGYQNDGSSNSLSRLDKVAACMKHFIVYPSPLNGQDQGPVTVTTHELYDIYYPSFNNAINIANVRSGMSAYHCLNDEPLGASKRFLTDLLRKELNFTGMLVTDYMVINQLHFQHMVAATTKDAAEMSMRQTTIDMNMAAVTTNFYDELISLVKEGKISEDRVDMSVERIMQMKKDLGLLAPDYMQHIYDPNAQVGTANDKAKALAAARESIILLQNNNTLPLNPSVRQRVLLTGPGSNSGLSLTGGWTVHWQGPENDGQLAYKTTILQAMQNLVAGTQITLDWKQGLSIDQANATQTMQEAVKAAQLADVVVVVVAEKIYAELPGDIPDIRFDPLQMEFVRQLQATNKPVVMVILEGRPRVLPQTIVWGSKSIILGIFPGPDGGIPIAEIILGKLNPSGRLPLTYPKATNQVPIRYWHKPSFNTLGGPQWEYGYGLSFTTFTYANFRTNAKVYRISDPNFSVSASVDVTNSGPRDGKQTVLLFVDDEYRSVEKEVKLLKAFTKIDLLKNQQQRVSFQLNKRDFSFTGLDGKLLIEPGNFTLSVDVGAQAITTQITLIP